jgi:hypothetical protein
MKPFLKPVFMVNDIGGIVYVGKNELHIQFEAGDGQCIKIDTKKLLALLESRAEEVWRSKEFEIERDTYDNSLLVKITVIYNETDDDWAKVFRCDLVEALKLVESSEIAVINLEEVKGDSTN